MLFPIVLSWSTPDGAGRHRRASLWSAYTRIPCRAESGKRELSVPFRAFQSDSGRTTNLRPSISMVPEIMGIRASRIQT